MTLREKLIEAGARAMERIANADEAEEVTWLEMVEVGLDAMLDCLAENMVETVHVTAHVVGPRKVPMALQDVDAEALVQLLMEDR